MTPKFDKLIKELLEEDMKCKIPTGIRPSDHPDFRFQKCCRNPYSTGIRKVYFWRKDGTFNFNTCKKRHKRGTESGEACALFKKILYKRKLAAARKAKNK